MSAELGLKQWLQERAKIKYPTIRIVKVYGDNKIYLGVENPDRFSLLTGGTLESGPMGRHLETLAPEVLNVMKHLCYK